MDGDPSVAKDEAVAYIAQPLLKMLAHKRWEQAALSRWSGATSCLKRMVVGAVLNNILHDSLAALVGRTQLDERKVQAELKECGAERQVAGEASDDCKWLQHCRRIIRPIVYFHTPGRRWQMGVALVVSPCIDKHPLGDHRAPSHTEVVCCRLGRPGTISHRRAYGQVGYPHARLGLLDSELEAAAMAWYVLHGR